MADDEVKVPATEYGEKLIRRGNDSLVASLGTSRVMTQQMMRATLGKLDPENIGMPQLYAMRRHPMIKMGLYYRKAPLLTAKWHMKCEDPRIAQAADETVRAMYGAYVRSGLMKFDFGKQAQIKRWGLGRLESTYLGEDGSERPVWTSKSVSPVVLRKPIPVPPQFADPLLDEDTGEFKGFRVLLPSKRDDTDVEVGNALWWVNEFEDTFYSWHGYPLTGHAYFYWWSSRFRHMMEDRHFEADADPAAHVQYPKGHSTVDGRSVPNKQIAMEIGEEIRSGSTVVTPSEVHVDRETGMRTTVPMWKVDFLRGGENLNAFRQSAEYLDIMMLRSLLVPEQTLIEGVQGSGARATASVQSTIYEEGLSQEAEQIAEMFNLHVLPQWLEANFGADAPPVRMEMAGFQEEDIGLASKLVEIAFNLDPNALPLDWEKILRDVKIPLLSKEEQRKREEEAAAKEAEAAAQTPPVPEPPLPEVPAIPPPGATVNASGQYFRPRDVIHLSASGERLVDATPPGWSKREHTRREKSTAAVAERIEEVARQRYEAIFAAAAQYVEETSLDELGLDLSADVNLARVPKNAFQRFMQGLALAIRKATSVFDRRIRGEMAGMYHAAGTAELQRLGLDLSSWEVGRPEVQTWAQREAGRLIKTMDQTVVERHLRPMLEKELPLAQSSGELAQKISEKFEGYPLWMAKRVARTEARMGYNQSAADLWERVGLAEVTAFDGQGGLSGKTDEECLRRNGQVMTLDEAREEDRKEHPNGTLGFMPVIPEGFEPREGWDTPERATEVLASASTYAVRDGLILSQQETGQLLAA